MRLRIYSKPDCHLCEEAKSVLQKIASEFNVAIDEINIENDSELFERYRYEIPVVFLDDAKLFKYRVDESKLRLALSKRNLT